MDMDGPSDQRLVRAARSGDGPAFAQLVSRHYPVLLASCQRMLANVDLARDAAQEAALERCWVSTIFATTRGLGHG